ncbi:transcriptional regulator FtsR [Demequina activiva]|uniref:MerR family transcriptional regulator n=1 Tax=Demequina activiva TaxID=1582364 RepID=A0A919Q2B1_9MICO|nr:MerR family transcriptional regulator [Demequina activiva]GIG54571.1 MerR family transcriptional regulator [Demequina activiva]
MPALRAVEQAPEPERPAGAAASPWPQQLSHAPELRVSDVLAQLVREFPALTPSKLRFLDSNGLVSPHRTGAGYRQYSAADVERLRFVLTQQRDQYLPLSAIAQQLADLDAGRTHQPVGPRAVAQTTQQLTRRQVAEAAGVEEDTVATLEAAGIIAQSGPGRYERAVVPLVVAGGAYLATGADPRSLSALVRAAGREAQLARDAARPRRERGDDTTADALIRERADAAVAVFSAWVHEQIDR